MDELLSATLRRWQQETQTQTTPEVSTQELFDRWAQEDANMTNEESEAEKELWERIEEALRENRFCIGKRTIFSD